MYTSLSSLWWTILQFFFDRKVSVTSERTMMTWQQSYYETEDLGPPSLVAAMGNPLKGLAGGARYAPPPLPDAVPLSLEFYNFGLDEIMIGYNAFNWDVWESLLAGSASRSMHAVCSVYIHWPGNPLRLPPHLHDIEMRPMGDTGEYSPYYGDPKLLEALQQFIQALAGKYDGDTRIANIHLGLLGYWGEFHTFPYDFVPESAKDSVVQWYKESFSVTQLQARYPRNNDTEGLGYYDGSFAYNTVDGIANGAVEMSWFFWPQLRQHNAENSWQRNIMGGETRPELQKTIFTDEYPAGTELHQDFALCASITHMTYILHHDAFQNGGYTGNQLQRARNAHALLGYNFRVSKVTATVSISEPDAIDITATVVQDGIAPFYYDLALVLEAECLTWPRKLEGVNEIVNKGESKSFLFANIPSETACLNRIVLRLDSSYAYESRPVLFAQGDGTVSFQLPMPNV